MAATRQKRSAEGVLGWGFDPTWRKPLAIRAIAQRETLSLLLLFLFPTTPASPGLLTGASSLVFY